MSNYRTPLLTRDYAKLISDALRLERTPEKTDWCWRVFVSCKPSGPATEEHRRRIRYLRTAARQLGVVFQSRTPYGDVDALYVGYDSASGRELARGTALVAALRSVGIECERREHLD